MDFKKVLLMLMIAAPLKADTGFGVPNVLVSEQDGNPKRRPIQELSFSNGTVTIQGTKASITNSGGGGGAATSLTLTDTDLCTWGVTVNTLGNLITTLGSCPAVVQSRPCSPGQSIGLLLGLTCSETLGF